MNKVWGIGLSKTGTKSLTAALQILGLKARHYPAQDSVVKALQQGRFDLSMLEPFDALVDMPVPQYFAQFDQQYPGSRFILTVREIEEWLQSFQRHHRRLPPRWRKNPAWQFMRLTGYGTLEFQADQMRNVYVQHLQQVDSYFAGRRHDLLVYPLCAGAGWQPLCDFLKVPVPELPFPAIRQPSELRCSHT